MDRRTFIAALPAASLIPAAARAQAKHNPGPGQGGAPAANAPAPFWSDGDERFLRPDVHAGDRPVGASFASRTAVYGMNGAAGTAHPLATQAGIAILQAGGSAVDAAIAINACLGFLEPTSSGVGGDCYAMVWDPKTQKVVGLAGSGASPRGLSLEAVRGRFEKRCAAPARRDHRVGAGRGRCMVDAAPALRKTALGGRSCACDRVGRGGGAGARHHRLLYPPLEAVFARSDNGVEETANALRTYGLGGREGSAGGTGVSQSRSRTDLSCDRRWGTRRVLRWGHRAGDRSLFQTDRRLAPLRGPGPRTTANGIEPSRTDYRGTTVHCARLRIHRGIATLQMLNIIERFDMRGFGFQSPRALHVMAEAKRLAYEDRARFYADPHFSKTPVEWLISKDYAASRAKLIKLDAILAARLSRHRAEPWRHHLFQLRRQRRHDGVDDPVQFSRHGIGARRGWDGRGEPWASCFRIAANCSV